MMSLHSQYKLEADDPAVLLPPPPPWPEFVVIVLVGKDGIVCVKGVKGGNDVGAEPNPVVVTDAPPLTSDTDDVTAPDPELVVAPVVVVRLAMTA